MLTCSTEKFETIDRLTWPGYLVSSAVPASSQQSSCGTCMPTARRVGMADSTCLSVAEPVLHDRGRAQAMES